MITFYNLTSFHKFIRKYRPKGYAKLLKIYARLSHKGRNVLMNIGKYKVQLDLSLNADIGHFIYGTIPHEAGLELLIQKCLSTDTVLYDIGSNIGYYSFLFSNKCKKIYAFEPNPFLYSRLMSTNSGVQSNIDFFNCGLSNENGELFFQYNKATHGLGNFRTNTESSTSVEIKRLDDLFAETQMLPPDILKIDVEGFELNVLKGAEVLIVKYRPIIFFEFAEDFANECGYNFTDVESFFSNLSYALLRVENDGSVRNNEIEKAKTGNDLMAIHKESKLLGMLSEIKK